LNGIMGSMDWTTTGIAIYAAIVATAAAAWSAYGIWRDRALVRVEVRFGVEGHSPQGSWLRTWTWPDGRPVTKDTRLIVSALNRGRRPVVLSNGGLRFRDGTKSLFTGDGAGRSFPHRLEEGESHHTWIYVAAMQERFRQDEVRPPIWAYWATETGHIYKTRLSKKLLKEISETTPGVEEVTYS
jgi:hypothetical protein